VRSRFLSPQAAQVAGCSYRQLDSWVRAGLVVPRVAASGSGSRREFDFPGLVRASLLAELVAFGVPPGAARVDELLQRGEVSFGHGRLVVDVREFRKVVRSRVAELEGSWSG